MTDLITPTHPAPDTVAVGAMTITGLTERLPAPVLRPVVVDLYRDIHKAIRSELFDTTLSAGRLDPADREGRADLCARVHGLVLQLEGHAEHEDAHIEPVLELHLPALAEQIEADHLALGRRIVDLAEQASAIVDAPGAELRFRTHAVYLELADFTSAYLHHQDLEERVVMPALEAAVGPDEVGAINGAIVSSIPPEEMARALASMIPMMNVEDRVETLTGMQAGAPPEAFAGVWSLVASVLEPVDVAQLAGRLGVS